MKPEPRSSCGECPMSERNRSRRGFLKTAWGLVVVFLGAGSVASLRFLFPRTLYEKQRIFKAGRLEDYPVGAVSNRWMREQKVLIARTAAGLYAISATCTHLGCTVNWFQEEGLFKCPCHGSNFTLEGEPISGPAPKPLYRLGVRVDPDGILVVDGSRRENRPGKRESDDYNVRG